MSMTKNQRFGLIVFIILIIASILVTTEPWKRSSATVGSAVGRGTPPANIRILWPELSAGYPSTATTDTVLSYIGFDLGYNEQFEQAAWVAYVLTREETESGEVGRTEDFRADTSVRTGSATPADYRGSGFDRGHLAPAGDMTWDQEAMSQSFLMTNMSPQRPGFNRGVWRRLETAVRNWAAEKDSIYVITGPLFSASDSLIGENGVGVPEHYFKVLVDLSPPDYEMIAFLLPNDSSSDDLLHFAISVDSLEQYSGYDFFASAPDQEVVEWLEGHVYPDHWQ
jgi:endonuclease G, mitochondrial